MKQKWIFTIFIFFLNILIPFNNIYAENEKGIEKLIFVRHAEKSFPDYGQLNCQGLNRAIALPRVLHNYYGKADFIFAPRPYVKISQKNLLYAYVRALATIEPTAIHCKKEVIRTTLCVDVKNFAAELLSPKYHSAKIFIAWEHLHISKIIYAMIELLGKDGKQYPIRRWPESDFDSIYEVTIDWNKFPPVFSINYKNENLNGLSKNCPIIALPENITSKHSKQKFVIIPEVETINDEHNIVTCKGLNRAIALSNEIIRLYPKVNLFFIPSNYNVEYLPSLLTIEPSIIPWGLYPHSSGHTLQDTIDYFATKFFHGRVTIISYPTNVITDLVRGLYQKLGGDPNDIPSQSEVDHDFIYEITNDPKKHSPVFRLYLQHLNSLPDICPGFEDLPEE